MTMIREPKGRREIQKEKVRQAIIASAEKCFAEKGIKKTAITDITENANIAVGTFYNYFESKEAILLFFATGIVEAIQDAAKGKIGKGISAKEALRDVANLSCEEFGKKLFLAPRMLVGRSKTQREIIPFWTPLTEKLCSAYANIIKYGQKRNEFRTDVSAVIAAEMVLAIFQSAFAGGMSKMSIRDNIKMKLKIFLKGMES